jgi:putative hydrolase of the HAD superfamily
MSIRAVIFDYGEVLCHPDPSAHRNLLALTGLDHDTFERHYWRDRRSYDLGVFEGTGFWAQFARDAGLAFTPDQVQALIASDILLWSALDEQMLAWARALRQAGIATAILSNMIPDLLRRMRQEFAWLGDFANSTFSCDLGLAKPDPAIYTFACEQLGVRPEEALFIDDRPENIAAAERLGLHAILFTTMDQLRHDLAARPLLRDLPPPAPHSP